MLSLLYELGEARNALIRDTDWQVCITDDLQVLSQSELEQIVVSFSRKVAAAMRWLNDLDGTSRAQKHGFDTGLAEDLKQYYSWLESQIYRLEGLWEKETKHDPFFEDSLSYLHHLNDMFLALYLEHPVSRLLKLKEQDDNPLARISFVERDFLVSDFYKSASELARFSNENPLFQASVIENFFKAVYSYLHPLGLGTTLLEGEEASFLENDYSLIILAETNPLFAMLEETYPSWLKDYPSMERNPEVVENIKEMARAYGYPLPSNSPYFPEKEIKRLENANRQLTEKIKGFFEKYAGNNGQETSEGSFPLFSSLYLFTKHEFAAIDEETMEAVTAHYSGNYPFPKDEDNKLAVSFWRVFKYFYDSMNEGCASAPAATESDNALRRRWDGKASADLPLTRRLRVPFSGSEISAEKAAGMLLEGIAGKVQDSSHVAKKQALSNYAIVVSSLLKLDNLISAENYRSWLEKANSASPCPVSSDSINKLFSNVTGSHLQYLSGSLFNDLRKVAHFYGHLFGREIPLADALVTYPVSSHNQPRRAR